MKRWYVVHTHAAAEARARLNLERQGYLAWLPLYLKRRRHAGRTQEVLRPLFPRYLFVALDPERDAWRPILSTFGVSQLVGGPEGPLPVPEPIIDGLRARADAEGVFALHAPRPRPGERVRILHGPLADLEGVFETVSDAERVMILLKLMGRAVRVTVSDADIEAL